MSGDRTFSRAKKMHWFYAGDLVETFAASHRIKPTTSLVLHPQTNLVASPEGSFTIKGSPILNASLHVKGNASLDGNLNLAGNASIEGDLKYSRTATLSAGGSMASIMLPNGVGAQAQFTKIYDTILATYVYVPAFKRA